MITGSLVALVTPMQPDGSIDWPALKALVEWHIAEGTPRHRRGGHDRRVGNPWMWMSTAPSLKPLSLPSMAVFP
jgi:hypothetical protein